MKSGNNAVSFGNQYVIVLDTTTPQIISVSCDSLVPCDAIIPCDAIYSLIELIIQTNYINEIDYFKHEEELII